MMIGANDLSSFKAQDNTEATEKDEAKQIEQAIENDDGNVEQIDPEVSVKEFDCANVAATDSMNLENDQEIQNVIDEIIDE